MIDLVYGFEIGEFTEIKQIGNQWKVVGVDYGKNLEVYYSREINPNSFIEIWKCPAHTRWSGNYQPRIYEGASYFYGLREYDPINEIWVFRLIERIKPGKFWQGETNRLIVNLLSYFAKHEEDV